jgi:predicted nucleotidyltransferase
MTRYPSPLDPDAAAELDAVREAILTVVGPSLVGLYLFGSLARGEFDTGISDIDLIAVLMDSPNEELAARLGRMHENLIRANPDWDDRIEVIYASREGLANCRTDTTTIGVIKSGRALPHRSGGKRLGARLVSRTRGLPPVDRAADPHLDPADSHV